MRMGKDECGNAWNTKALIKDEHFVIPLKSDNENR
jgi:hypothetical protein